MMVIASGAAAVVAGVGAGVAGVALSGWTDKVSQACSSCCILSPLIPACCAAVFTASLGVAVVLACVDEVVAARGVALLDLAVLLVDLAGGMMTLFFLVLFVCFKVCVAACFCTICTIWRWQDTI